MANREMKKKVPDVKKERKLLLSLNYQIKNNNAIQRYL